MFGGSFIPSFIFNVAQGKDPLEATKNAMIDGTVSTIAGNFGSAIGPNFNTPGFGSVQNAANVPSLLTDGAVNAAYTGPTSMMTNLNPANIANVMPETGQIMPSFMDTTGVSYDQIAQVQGPGGFEPYLTVDRKTNLAPLGDRTDVPQVGSFNTGPDMSKVITPDAQDVAKAGGYEEVPLYKQATDKIVDYVKDKPLESAFMAATVGGSIYEGMKGPQKQTTVATLGPKIGSNFQPNKDKLVNVYRSKPITSRIG